MKSEIEKLVYELFDMVDADSIADDLSDMITAYVEDEINSCASEPNGSYLANKVFMNSTLISFFYKLEKANARAKAFRISELN